MPEKGEYKMKELFVDLDTLVREELERLAICIYDVFSDNARDLPAYLECSTDDEIKDWYIRRVWNEFLNDDQKEQVRRDFYAEPEPEEEDDDEEYIPSATNGDYGPGDPWNAPGMSVSDFITGVVFWP